MTSLFIGTIGMDEDGLINHSSDSSVSSVISPFALPVQKHLRFQRLKLNLTLILLVPLRLKLLLEKKLINKQGLISVLIFL